MDMNRDAGAMRLPSQTGSRPMGRPTQTTVGDEGLANMPRVNPAVAADPLRRSTADRAPDSAKSTAAGTITSSRPLDRELPKTAEALGLITTAALAPVLGKANARAARDWCSRHGIPYRRDGKHNWVLLRDVKRVLDNLPVHGGAHRPPREYAATTAVAALTGRR